MTASCDILHCTPIALSSSTIMSNWYQYEKTIEAANRLHLEN